MLAAHVNQENFSAERIANALQTSYTDRLY